MSVPTVTKKPPALMRIEIASIVTSSVAIAASWIVIWSLGDPNTYCDVYCGPLPGLGAIYLVLFAAGVIWLAALVLDVVVLFIGRSRLLAVILLIALVAVPPLSAMIFG
jgi:hypothetical protein